VTLVGDQVRARAQRIRQEAQRRGIPLGELVLLRLAQVEVQREGIQGSQAEDAAQTLPDLEQ
jgi:hypothetical protein